EALLAKASLFDVRAGDRILRPGEREHGLLVVVSGEATDGVTTLSPGDVSGDVAGRFLRHVDSELVAATAGSVLVLPAGHVEHLLATRDDRLGRLQGRLADLLAAQPFASEPTVLPA